MSIIIQFIAATAIIYACGFLSCMIIYGKELRKVICEGNRINREMKNALYRWQSKYANILKDE